MSLLKNDFKKELSIVILCAGEGTRLKQITKILPKPLIKIESLNNISILHHLINNLIKLEISNIGIVIGHLGNSIRQFISTLEINEPSIKNKLNIIDSEDQYKLGPLYSLLSITKNRHFFKSKTHYLILPGDTIFGYNLLKEVLVKIFDSLNFIQNTPLIFYRKIEFKQLKEVYKQDRVISVADITKFGSETKLKRISHSKLKDIPPNDIVYQLIPIIVLSYENINEIHELNQQNPQNTIWKALNELNFTGKKIFAFEIEGKSNFYDIDYKIDLKNLKEKRKGQ
ncbi:MAG: NTP transferase domain-containing protein [Candidatus Lokiarchaeia archaeon]|nr:NTP transferase domain-containing protein [Candidatus Lokiarchaeia archaeon]